MAGLCGAHVGEAIARRFPAGALTASRQPHVAVPSRLVVRLVFLIGTAAFLGVPIHTQWLGRPRQLGILFRLAVPVVTCPPCEPSLKEQ